MGQSSKHSDTKDQKQVAIPPMCFCGATTVYQDSKAYYHGHRSYGMRWICSRWPECDGSVGAHPDGKPLGTVPSAEDKKYRSMLHAQIDPLWQNQERSKKRARGSVYGWLRRILNMTADECHIGNFNAETCIEALEQIALHPYEHRHSLVIDLAATDKDASNE
jgi:hypothetical protein